MLKWRGEAWQQASLLTLYQLVIRHPAPDCERCGAPRVRPFAAEERYNLPMQRWEYKILTGPAKKLEDDINAHAKEAWEAISISVTAGGACCLLRRVVARLQGSDD